VFLPCLLGLGLGLGAVAGTARSWVAYGGDMALNSGDEDGVAIRWAGRRRGRGSVVVRFVAMAGGREGVPCCEWP
jgi:hypothetical protein